MTNKKSAPDRPVGILISGKSSDNTFENVQVFGDVDALRIEGEASGNTFENFTHVVPGVLPAQAKKWWERPIGIVGMTIFCGLVVAALTFYFGWK